MSTIPNQSCAFSAPSLPGGWLFRDNLLPASENAQISCVLVKGNRIFTGSQTGDVCIWDAQTKQVIQRWPQALSGSITQLKVSGESLSAQDDTGCLRIFNTTAPSADPLKIEKVKQVAFQGNLVLYQLQQTQKIEMFKTNQVFTTSLFLPEMTAWNVGQGEELYVGLEEEGKSKLRTYSLESEQIVSETELNDWDTSRAVIKETFRKDQDTTSLNMKKITKIETDNRWIYLYRSDESYNPFKLIQIVDPQTHQLVSWVDLPSRFPSFSHQGRLFFIRHPIVIREGSEKIIYQAPVVFSVICHAGSYEKYIDMPCFEHSAPFIDINTYTDWHGNDQQIVRLNQATHTIESFEYDFRFQSFCSPEELDNAMLKMRMMTDCLSEGADNAEAISLALTLHPHFLEIFGVYSSSLSHIATLPYLFNAMYIEQLFHALDERDTQRQQVLIQRLKPICPQLNSSMSVREMTESLLAVREELKAGRLKSTP